MFDTAVLISSWDKNKNLWPVVKRSFDKYWKDCPYPIYFITNFETAPIGKTINVGDERGWAINTMNALKSFESKAVIWTLDDYWFTEKVNTGMMKKYVSYVEQGKTDYIRLIPSAVETRLPFKHDHSLHYYALNSPNKTSLGPSIWNKELLTRLLRPNETIWQFECEAVNRTTRNDVFLFVVKADVLKLAGPHYDGSPYNEQMMVRGKMTESAHLYCRNEGIDFSG